MRWPLMGETITLSDRLKMAKFVLTTKKFTNGEKVKKFEREWNEWLGSKNSIYVSSGSTANFLLVAAMKEKYGLKNGDKVLLPACTWVTNVAPIIQLGLEPIFCDINLQNFSFNMPDVRAIATKHNIKAIFVTHLLGFPGENERLREIFPKALIIDDVCESHGCLDTMGNKVGSNSLGATFSFYFGHHMSTIEGGMVSSNDDDLFDLMKMKRSHGMARESTNFNYYASSNSNIEKSFLFMTDGYNFRNHEVCAVLGSSQLKRLDKMIEQRKSNYQKYVSIINDFPNLFLPHRYEPYNSSFCFPFICKTISVMKAMKDAFTRHGIEYRPVVSGNLMIQPFLRSKYKIAIPKDGYLVDVVQKQGVYIGNNHFIGDDDMTFLESVVEEIDDKFSKYN